MASAEETIERAHAAVVALYDAGDVARREAANAHLVALRDDPSAVDVALALLERARGDADVAFFAANLLSSKTKERDHWRGMDVGRRSEVLGRMKTAFAATAADASLELAARRLALALASAVTKCGVDETMDVVRLARGVASTSGMDGGGMRCGTELLALAAEACDEAETSARRTLAQAMANECEVVLNMVKEIFVACGSSRSKERDALKASCVRAIRAWLKLDPAGDVHGGLRVTPTEFAMTHGQLFGDVIQCLAIDSSGCGSAAVDMLVELHQGRSGAEVEEFQAMNAVTRGLLSHAQEANGHDGAFLARNIAFVAVALSERCVNVISRGDDDSLALVSLLLSLMERHGREVTEVAVDFFLMMDTVGVSSRHESLRAPMHARLVEVMLKQATLPHDFTSWEEAEEDKETFERFREHVLADLLDNCYGVLRGQYFSIVGTALSTAQNWCAAEAGAFALRAPADRVVEDLEESSSPEIESFLAQLFSSVAEHTSDNSGIFSSHPLVRASTCRLISSYARWMGRRGSNAEAQATLAQGVLTYVISSFPHPSAWPRAAVAFRSICAKCTRFLKDEATFVSLLEHTERCLGSVRLTFDSADAEDDRTAVMEGLARVIAAMPIKQASKSSARLISPIVVRCKAFSAEMSSQIPPNQFAHAEASRGVAAELSLIASSVRFLEFTPNAAAAANVEHPAISVLAASWPILEELVAARTWQTPGVVKAAAEIYVAALLSAKSNSVNMIVPMLESIARQFTATKYPCLFEPISTAIEVASISSPESGESELLPSAPQVGVAMSAAFAQIAGETVACARADPSSAETWERAEALFSTAKAFVMFAPARGLSNDALFDVLDLAVAALELREYAPVRAALALLNTLASPGEKSKASPPWVANAARVDEFFLTRGARIAETVLRAACSEITPRAAIRAAATLLITLHHAAPDVVSSWIAAAVHRPTDASPSPSPFVAECERPLLHVLSIRPPLPRPRLIAVVCDYVLACVGLVDARDFIADTAP